MNKWKKYRGYLVYRGIGRGKTHTDSVHAASQLVKLLFKLKVDVSSWWMGMEKRGR